MWNLAVNSWRIAPQRALPWFKKTMELINLGSRLVNYLRPANEPHWKLPQTGINNPVGLSTVSIWNSEEECHFCPLGAMNSNLDSHIAKMVPHTSMGSTEILNEELGIPTGWWIPEANMDFETSLGWEYLFQRPEVRGFRRWAWACASMPRKIPYWPASNMSSPKRAEHSAGGGRRGHPRCLARGPHLQEVLLAGWSLRNRGMQNFHLKFTAWVGLLRLLTGIPRWVERKAEHKRPTNGFKNRSYALETFISFFFWKHSFQPSLVCFISFLFKSIGLRLLPACCFCLLCLPSEHLPALRPCFHVALILCPPAYTPYAYHGTYAFMDISVCQPDCRLLRRRKKSYSVCFQNWQSP